MTKKYFILALAAFTMAACNNDEEGVPTNGNAQVGEAINPVLLYMAEGTRESMSVDLVNKWVDGDAVGIFSQWDKNLTGNSSQYVNNGTQNARFQFYNSFIYGGTTYTNRWAQDGLLDKTLTTDNAVQWAPESKYVDTPYNFYVYYPYASGASQTAVPFALSNEQTQTTANEWANAGSSIYNFMYSSNKDMTRPADRNLPLNLTRLAPVAEFSIIRDDNSLDGYFLQNVVLTASGLKAGMCNIDLTSVNKYASLPFMAATSVPSFTLTTATNTAVPSTGIAVSSVELTEAFKVYMSVNNFNAGSHTVTALFSNGTDTKTITLTRAKAQFEVKDGKGNLVQYYLRASDAKGTSIPPTSVTVNPTSLSLNKGQSATISATVYPTNTTSPGVTWTTSNSSVATVDANGKVTAIGTGTAVITATDAAGHKATCTVTVTSAAITFLADAAKGTLPQPTVTSSAVASVTSITSGYQITPTSATFTYGFEGVPTAKSGYQFTGWTVSGAASGNNGTFALGTTKSVADLYTIEADGSIVVHTTNAVGIFFVANFGTGTPTPPPSTIVNFKSVYTIDDYWAWDAYNSFVPYSDPLSGSWGSTNAYCNTSLSGTATAGCKDCATRDQIAMYLGAGVFFDDGHTGANQQTYTLPNGETYHYGYWLKKKKNIPGFDAGTATKASLPLKGIQIARPDASVIDQYFFLPCTGWYIGIGAGAMAGGFYTSQTGTTVEKGMAFCYWTKQSSTSDYQQAYQFTNTWPNDGTAAKDMLNVPTQYRFEGCVRFFVE